MSERIDVVLKGGAFDGSIVDKACNCQLNIDCPFDPIEKKVVKAIKNDCIKCEAIYSQKGIFHKYVLVLSNYKVLLNENYEVISKEKTPLSGLKVWDHPFKEVKILFEDLF